MNAIIFIAALAGLAISGCASSDTDSSENLQVSIGTTTSEAAAATTTVQPSDAPAFAAPLDSDADIPDCTQNPARIENSPRESVESALQNRYWEGFSPLVDPARIISGGVRPDDIPPIENPNFLCPGEVDFLSDTEPVLSLTIGPDSRAYPVEIMTWHEIVNDVVNGIPVTVTYCPLCNSAVSHGRQLDNRVLDFGTSGFLYNSSLVMYDRQTETLWTHFEGRAVIGELEGAELEYFPVAIVSWGDWKKANPNGRVLDRVYDGTGRAIRDYGRNPYADYLRNGLIIDPNVNSEERDDRLGIKTLVVGIRTETASTAIVREDLSAKGAINFELEGLSLTAWHIAGTNSALDTSEIARGIDIGSVAVFERQIDSCALPEDAGNAFGTGTDSSGTDGSDCGIKILEFELVEGEIRDKQTESVWNIFGEAISGDLAGSGLTPREFLDTFWFAWSGFNPDTSITGQ